MIFERFYLGCLSQASYLVADPATKLAAVVDPRRDVEVYLAFAKKKKLTIRWVLLTHFHADFVAGHLELKARTGAQIALGGLAKADYQFRALSDGETLDLGPNVAIETLWTPGHTPEAVCYAVYDHQKDPDAPVSLLTGDTLFVGDVGRPDLMASQGVTAKQLAGRLYDSLHKKLAELPDQTLVYPGHGAGSACGKNLGSEDCTTLGAQRRSNYAMKRMPKSDFVKLVTADLPPAPAYFAHDAALNRTKRATLDRSLKTALTPLSVAEARKLRSSGAVWVDVRDAADYAKAHAEGSIHVGLEGRFAPWAGAVLPRDKKLVLVCEPGAEQEAAMRLGRIGLDLVVGFVKGGAAALKKAGEPLVSTGRVTAAELRALLKGPNPPKILDVRAKGERERGRIEGSVHIPLDQLEKRAKEVPAGDCVIHCAGGYRSMIAASLLERAGRTGLKDLEGGFAAWTE